MESAHANQSQGKTPIATYRPTVKVTRFVNANTDRTSIIFV